MLTIGLDGASMTIGRCDRVDDTGCRSRLLGTDEGEALWVPRPGSAPTTPGNGSPWGHRCRDPLSRHGFRNGRRRPAGGWLRGDQRRHSASVTCESGYPHGASGCGPNALRDRGRPIRTNPAVRRRPPIPPWRSRFRLDAPSRVRGRCHPQGVHAGVQVGADPDAVHPRVVTDVDHRCQFMIKIACGSGYLGAELPEPQ